MSKQIYENLLDSFKRANKDRKQKIVEKNGFDNIIAYQGYLENKILMSIEPNKEFLKSIDNAKNQKPIISIEKEIEKPIIHIVDILDVSSSMAIHNRMGNANYGILQSFNNLRKENSVEYTYTLALFDHRVEHRFIKENLNKVNTRLLSGKPQGSTSLYDAIGVTIELLEKETLKKDKVLINIYTDGEENSSVKYNRTKVEELIRKCQSENYTITFIGTENDTIEVIRRLSIDKSNTLVYDGTGEGLAQSLNITMQARSEYTSKVTKGENVSKGFYKDFVKK